MRRDLAKLDFTPEVIIATFHGMPQSYSDAGDPYYHQCQETSALLRDALGWPQDKWLTTYQSRFGNDPWLQPYTDELLVQYAKGKHRRISVICPGFATDCLETLEEIAIRNRALFLESGGEAYDYIPALNATDPHVATLADLIVRNAQGWQAA